MNQADIDATIAFHAHEAGTDAAGRAERAWLDWAKKVETLIGHDLDGDQDADGYSIDRAVDLYESKWTAIEAADAFMDWKNTITMRAAT